MKKGDFYTHFKGGEYYFDCIALPLEERESGEKIQTARYHDDTRDVDLYVENGVTFIDAEVPHVIYQAEKDYDTNKVWAREVDDFFGYKHLTGSHFQKRFTLKT
jgi:hypothetical protein